MTVSVRSRTKCTITGKTPRKHPYPQASLAPCRQVNTKDKEEQRYVQRAQRTRNAARHSRRKQQEPEQVKQDMSHLEQALEAATASTSSTMAQMETVWDGADRMSPDITLLDDPFLGWPRNASFDIIEMEHGRDEPKCPEKNESSPDVRFSVTTEPGAPYSSASAFEDYDFLDYANNEEGH